MASHADAVLAWAAHKNIRAIRLQASAPLALADLSGLEFDYLFNIASVMARARKLAIVQDLERGDLPLTAESGTRSYFGARKRLD